MFTRCSCPRREKISRRKSLAAPGTRTRISGWALAFQSDALSIELSPPPNNNNNSSNNNNNNKYLERLTRTGPKRLHVLYKYILSKFSAYNMNAHTRARTHRDSHTHARARTRTRTHTHTSVAYQGNQGNETEAKVFKKRKVFKKDLKELTEVEWRT